MKEMLHKVLDEINTTLDGRIAEYLAEGVYEKALRSIFNEAPYLKSSGKDIELTPIEQLMYSALIRLSRDDVFGVDTFTAILPQYQIKDYRVDFLVECFLHGIRQSDKNTICCVVECDGHEFHERTKAQASSDKKRDRDLQGLGLTVLRFSGSDIWKDPDGCAREVLMSLRKRLLKNIKGS